MLSLYDPISIDLHLKHFVINSPTIDNACTTIREATKGLGTDERQLIRVLSGFSPYERELIASRYKELYKQELTDLLKSETSGDFGYLLQLICRSLPETEAFLLRKATKGAGTKEDAIYPIIMGRTNEEIQILKQTYFDKYNEDLSALMNSELGGDFKKVILGMLQSPLLPYNPSFHTKEKVEEDAEKLYKSGQGKWGTDEETFLKTLFACPPEHLNHINDRYCQQYGNNLITAIEKEFSGDAKKALVFHVRLNLDPYSLVAEHFEHTMKGFGTDEKALSAALIRYHPWLKQVEEAYQNKYKKSLRERIHGEVSGDYRRLLLSLYDAPQRSRPQVHQVL